MAETAMMMRIKLREGVFFRWGLKAEEANGVEEEVESERGSFGESIGERYLYIYIYIYIFVYVYVQRYISKDQN